VKTTTHYSDGTITHTSRAAPLLLRIFFRKQSKHHKKTKCNDIRKNKSQKPC